MGKSHCPIVNSLLLFSVSEHSNLEVAGETTTNDC